MRKLTEAFVRDLAVPTTDEMTAWEIDLRGFGLRARPGGSKTWIVKYRTRHGRQRKRALGKWPTLSADEARRRAR
jgi:hypothetical protein